MAQPAIDDSSADGDWKFPLMLSFLAGASTSIGAGIVFAFSPAVIQHSMPFSLSLAASVMITVSVISIGPECLHGVVILSGETGEIEVQKSLLLQRVISFGLGCLSYFLLSKLLVMLPEPQTFMNTPKWGKIAADDELQVELDDASPKRPEGMSNNDVVRSEGNSRGVVRRAAANRESQLTMSSSFSAGSLESMASSGGDTMTLFDDKKNGEKQKLLLTARSSSSEERRRSWRVAMLLFVSLLCHNFPEGLAVVASTAESKELGVTVAIGIMIHNIPEGIAIAVPCMAARPDAPWLAFWLATLSGVAEPLGAVVALVVLRSSSSHSIKLPLENILACVAGIMCMVAIIELYPEALNHVKQKNYRGVVWGSLIGMLIMVATEWYLP